MSVEQATATVDTPLGALSVTAGPDGVAEITWEDPGESGEGADGPDGGPPGRSPAERTAAAAARQIDEYVRGERRSFDLVLDLAEQPPFRRRVLEELARLTYGETISYGELAARCGRPNAARAVGNAVGRNPVPVILPCHRVVRSDGSPGEYGGGRERKRELLRLEGAMSGSNGENGSSGAPSG